jgi:hypothetical protein
MGMQIAQTAQPISQQQPSQGKGQPQMPPPQEPPQNGSTPIGVLGSAMSGIGHSGKSGGVNNSMQNVGHGFEQQGQGKGGQSPQPTTNSATSGQPRMGQSNPYSNTIQPWDNGNNQTQSGKGKGH